ncbi:MAG: DNA gyrase inhibitor YacG [Acidobacteriota bacterium]
MQCPICHKTVAISDPFMPFCSDRCKLIDLGNWASEKYVISEPVSLLDMEMDDIQSDDPE